MLFLDIKYMLGDVFFNNMQSCYNIINNSQIE